MKNVLLLLTLMTCTGFSTILGAQDDVVYVEFTNRTTFADLLRIQSELKEKDITLEYLMIEFDEQNKYVAAGVTYINLSALRFKVNCNDGFEGSGTTRFLQNDHKISITRDYREGAQVPFGINVFGSRI